MVQANPFEAHQRSLAESHIDEPMSANCLRARSWIAEQFAPVVCVFSSNSVLRRMIDLNGLTPAEFLRPFGEVGNLSNYLVRSCDRNAPYKLNRFRVNFVDSHLMSDHPKPSDLIPERIMNEYKPKVRSEMATLASFSTHNSKKAVSPMSLQSKSSLFSPFKHQTLASNISQHNNLIYALKKHFAEVSCS